MGSTVDEPETLIVPVTAGAELAGAALSPLGAALRTLMGQSSRPLLLEHAPKASAAAKASAPTRLVVMVTRYSSTRKSRAAQAGAAVLGHELPCS